MNMPIGQHVWYELMTSDLAGAEAFYGTVIGWTVQDSGQPGPRYDMLKVGDQAVGGMLALSDEACAQGARPAWQAYISVADVDAAAQAVAADGGKIWVPATDIPGVGRFSMVSDPGGASFYLFRGMEGDYPPELPRGTPGKFAWHELYAHDLDAAWAFYQRHFGWTLADTMDMGPMGRYQMYCTAAGAEAAGGMMTKPPEVPRPCWLYYVNVPAIDAAVARITAGGGQILNGPMQVPGGQWIVNALDPQGAAFSLVAPAR
jgi:predicted enzyme related to lactoylglutathione lyase